MALKKYTYLLTFQAYVKCLIIIDLQCVIWYYIYSYYISNILNCNIWQYKPHLKDNLSMKLHIKTFKWVKNAFNVSLNYNTIMQITCN